MANKIDFATLTDDQKEQIFYIVVGDEDSHPNVLQFFFNIDEEFQTRIVMYDGEALKFIDNSTEKVKLEAVKQNGSAIQYIKPEDQTEEMRLVAVKESGYSLAYIKPEDQTEEMQLKAIKGVPTLNIRHLIQYIKNPTEKIQLIMVEAYGSNIKHIENPTVKVQIESIRQDVFNIQYIDNSDEIVQILALQKAIELIVALKKTMKLTNNNTNIFNKDLQELYFFLKYIKNATKKVQTIAIQFYSKSIDFVSNPTEEMIKISKMTQKEKDIYFNK